MRSVCYSLAGMMTFFVACNSPTPPPKIIQLSEKEFKRMIIPADSSERAMWITKVKDGYLLLGYSTRLDVRGDIMLYHLDPDLQITSMNNLGVPGFDFGFAGLLTSDEHLIIAGFTAFQSAGGLDAYLLKTTLNGDTLWTRKVGSQGDDRFIRVCETADGNYLAIGQTTSWGANDIDGLLVKMDTYGSELWRKTMGDSLLDRSYAIHELPSGEIMVAGITQANYPDDSDILLYRLSDQGEILWRRQIGGPHGEISHAMNVKDDGTFVSIGYSAENSAPLSDPFLLHFDDSGNTAGHYTDSTGVEIRLMDGYFASANQLICAGYIRDHLEDDWDAMITSFDFNKKEFRHYRIPDSTANQQFFHLCPTLDGTGVLAAGHTDAHGTSNILLSTLNREL